MSTETLVHPDLTDRLSRDGYTVVEDFIGRPEVDRLLEVFRSLDCPAQHGAWSASMYSTDVAYRTAVHEAIKVVVTSRAASLLPGYRICLCNFLVKETHQGDGGAVQIHQDPTFVDETRFDTLGIWIPLVDTSVRNGALAVLPRSQAWNQGPRAYGGVPTPYVDLLPAFVEHAQPIPMKAGSAIIFSQKLFHGSPANREGATRVSVAVLLAQKDAPLLCYYGNPALPEKLEVFEVDDLFYTRHIYGTRPQGVSRVAVVDRVHDPVGLAQVLASARIPAMQSQ
jgi:ectoine hydroxylase-related dioxygenase (phytanoyl-CoA dioxygenase family)